MNGHMIAPPQHMVAAPQQTQAQVQVPTAPVAPLLGPVQSLDLDDTRWKSLRGSMCKTLAGLAHMFGFNLVADAELLKMGFPTEDGSRFENGEMDMDFEESAIEMLGEVMLEAQKLHAIADRFQYNLRIRNHDPVAVEAEGEEAPAAPAQ